MGEKNLKYYNSRSFKIFYKKLKNSLNNDKKTVKNYQKYNLKKTLIYSYENIPFYKNIFDEINFNPYSFEKIETINKIPTINKKIILKNYKKFQNKSIKKSKIIYMTTGGSTGNPLLIPMTKDYKSKSLACTFFYMSHLGYSILNDKSVRIHGDLGLKNKVFKISKNKLILSSEKINIFNLKLIVQMINKFKPKYIHAYPSAIFLLCKLLQKEKIKCGVKIKAIFTDSEVLYEYQKKEIEKFFQCRIFNTYGHTEGAIFGVSTKKTKFIHLHPEVGFVQLIDPKSGKEIKNNNLYGELVVTGFLNNAFPLIRYKTGDIACYANIKNSDNVFKYKVLKKIEGREQDYIVNKNKELIPAAPLLFDYNINWSGVEKFQIEQKEIGKIQLSIKLINKKEKSSILKRIIKEFSILFDKNINIKYKIVPNIQSTRIGKYRYMKQFLNLKKIAI